MTRINPTKKEKAKFSKSFHINIQTLKRSFIEIREIQETTQKK